MSFARREGGGEDDDELGRLLDDPETNPLQLSEKIKQRQAQKRKEILGSDESGMQVRIRDVDTFDLWVWMELEAEASLEQQDMLEAVLTSWFMIGRLGGYNAMNLQEKARLGKALNSHLNIDRFPVVASARASMQVEVLYNTESRLSNMPYDQEQCESALQAFFHEMSDLEYQGKWARCWVNLGTADELALDILINTLYYFSEESVKIKQLLIGGEVEGWPVPKREKLSPDDVPFDPEDY